MNRKSKILFILSVICSTMVSSTLLRGNLTALGNILLLVVFVPLALFFTIYFAREVKRTRENADK